MRNHDDAIGKNISMFRSRVHEECSIYISSLLYPVVNSLVEIHHQRRTHDPLYSWLYEAAGHDQVSGMPSDIAYLASQIVTRRLRATSDLDVMVMLGKDNTATNLRGYCLAGPLLGRTVDYPTERVPVVLDPDNPQDRTLIDRINAIYSVRVLSTAAHNMVQDTLGVREHAIRATRPPNIHGHEWRGGPREQIPETAGDVWVNTKHYFPAITRLMGKVRKNSRWMRTSRNCNAGLSNIRIGDGGFESDPTPAFPLLVVMRFLERVLVSNEILPPEVRAQRRASIRHVRNAMEG